LRKEVGLMFAEINFQPRKVSQSEVALKTIEKTILSPVEIPGEKMAPLTPSIQENLNPNGGRTVAPASQTLHPDFETREVLFKQFELPHCLVFGRGSDSTHDNKSLRIVATNCAAGPAGVVVVTILRRLHQRWVK
jgi:hypothetical protein